jgi:hypothetical protein
MEGFLHDPEISNAQARVWQPATATANAAAKHMHFCQCWNTTKSLLPIYRDLFNYRI